MVQSMLAEMYVLVETMRTFTYRTLAAAASLEIGGGGRGDIHKLTAASVMYAAEACTTCSTRRCRSTAAPGYIWESEINRLYPLDQAAGDRRRHDGSAQVDHRRRIAEGHAAQ